ncbi:MAG: hypothetical protein FJX92_03955 [Bacteroidetes bacterium]|nr:hypothetical protein [Bacteroidota bacterium]
MVNPGQYIEKKWSIWVNQLPQPASELVEQFPFSGPLQLHAHSGSASASIRQALFSTFPTPQIPLESSADPKNSNSKLSPPSENEPFVFEPYHTVDYFASQGIKPPALDHTTDRFGQQLKSFTDWLKVMKRLPLTEVTRQIPVEKEKQVADLAHESLDEKQIWTEAMAAVWIKQGEKQKAIETYRQLSLLDPSKSAYFAAKINELNTLS